MLAKPLNPQSLYESIVLHYAKKVGITSDTHGFCVHSLQVGLTHNAAPELTLEEDSWDRRLAEILVQLEMARQKLMLANPAHDLTIFMVAEYASLFRPTSSTSSASEHTRRH